MVFFCPKCGSVLMPIPGERKVKMLCGCGYELKGKEVVIKETVKLKKPIEIATKKIPFPKTKAACPKCNNKEAYYWLVQTRSADEAETKFFECVKCSYRWRDYK